MAIRKIKWTQTARSHRNAFFKYWNSRNKSTSYSKKVRSELSGIQKILGETPSLYRETDYEGVRIVPRKNFSLYYTVMDTGDILILAFWGMQNPEKLSKVINDPH